MTLPADAFVRRFLLQVLPKGFHRMRRYSLLATGRCKTNIARARELLAAPAPPKAPKSASSVERRIPCPCCSGHMLAIESFEGTVRARALRSVADRLLDVACAMLKSRSVFDPKLTAKTA